MKNLNRVVAIASALISLALAALPVVLNFDWRSTAGVIAGIIALLTVTQTWLKGWQKYEQREFAKDNPHLVAPQAIVVRTDAASPPPPPAVEDESGDPVHPLAANYPEADPASIPPDVGNVESVPPPAPEGI